MRILYVISRADALGGASVHVRDMACEAERRGHHAVVAIGGSGPVIEVLESAGVRVQRIRHMRRELSPLHDIAALLELRNVVLCLKPDMVSAHASKAGFLGRLASKAAGVASIYTPHCWSFVDGFPRAGMYMRAERLAARWCSRIVAVSEQERQLALRCRVGRADQIVTIHNGMPDVAMPQRSNPEVAPPRLLMVARFEDQKDHATLLAALAGLRDLEWTLDLVGDGPNLPAVRVRSAALGLAERVRFLGYRKDIPEVMGSSQLFLLITNWEGFPRSILEAMRAGLPVVASDVGGNREAVQHQVTGFLVPKGSDTTLRDRLAELISNPGLRMAMGAAGRGFYENNFTFEQMANRTFALYREVLGEVGGSPGNVPGAAAVVGLRDRR